MIFFTITNTEIWMEFCEHNSNTCGHTARGIYGIDALILCEHAYAILV